MAQINYKEEQDKLKTQGDFWKPEPGKHNVILLSEPEDDEYVKDNGERVPQWRFNIEVEGKQKIWTIPRSTSKDSLRGQLIAVGAKRGKLSGERITLMISGTGKTRRYIVEEAL